MRARTFITISIISNCSLTVVPPAGAQSPSPAFNAPVIVGDKYQRITNTLELDGDGYADAVGWWAGNASGYVNFQGWLNDQNGSLINFWNYQLSFGGGLNYVNRSAVGDLTGDGLDDFVFANAGVILVFRSNGAGAPTLLKQWTDMSPAYGLTIADLNNDGRNDIALAFIGVLKIYFNTPGHGYFATSTSATINSIGAPLDLLAIEATGDGQMDLAWPQYDKIFVAPVVNGVIQPLDYYYVGNPTLAMPAAGDIDNDGDGDIVAFFNTKYTVLRRTGPSTFVVEPEVAGGPATNLADVDGDGDLDGACCGGGGGGYTQPINDGPSIFRVSINTGGGTFAPAFEIPGLGALHLAGVEDMDHDGDMDLVAGRCIYYSNGALAAAPIVNLAQYTIGEEVVSDYDGDGDPDLLFGMASALANDGTGMFTNAPVVFPALAAGENYAGPGFQGDFDGDADVDLIVQHFVDGNFAGMRFLMNAGGGGLVDGGPAAAPGVDMNQSQNYAAYINHPLAAITGDFDADGDEDIVTHTHQAPTFSSFIFKQSLAGTFFGYQFLYDEVIGAADLNGDGLLDLLAGKQTQYPSTYGTLRTYMNGGAGGFALGAEFSGDTYISENHVAIADFDDDGDRDVGFTPVSLLVRLQMNDGNANFSQLTPFPTNYIGSVLPRNVFGADVNNDGRTDLLASSVVGTSNGFYIALQGSGGSWESPSQQIGYLHALADFDGDGCVDIAGSRNDTLEKVARIIFNRHYAKPAGGVRRQFGASTPGTGGMAPTLGVAGPFTAGSVPEYRMTGVVGGTVVLIVVGDSEAGITNFPLPGLTSYTYPWIDFASAYTSGTYGNAGEGRVTLPVLVTPELAGRTFYLQGYAYDPAVASLITQTNGLQITYGL